MSDELLDLAIATAGGQELWNTLRGLKIDISIGGPTWAMKGCPPERTFDKILTLERSNSTLCSARSLAPTSGWSSTPRPRLEMTGESQAEIDAYFAPDFKFHGVDGGEWDYDGLQTYLGVEEDPNENAR